MRHGDETRRYARLHELFDRARHLSSVERDRFVAGECCGDDALRAELVALLDKSPADDGALGEAGIAAMRRKLEGALFDESSSAGDIPSKVGRYTILRIMGEGGGGVVYEATQESPNRRVALKVLPAIGATPERRQRFQREAELLGRLQHPGIAQVFEAGTFSHEGTVRPYFAMEFIDGVDLRTYVARAKTDVRGQLELIALAADAIHHAHSRGIVHRDIKPENLFVDMGGRPKVLDFGVARAIAVAGANGAGITRTGEVVGTLAYMAPEQLVGDHSVVTASTDVYALGVVAYELLAGRLPCSTSGLTVVAAIRVLVDSEPPRLGRLDGRLTGDIETIVAKALEKEPGRRYGTAAALAADLRRHLDDLPISARPTTAAYRIRMFARRHRSLIVSAAVTGVALVAGLVTALVFASEERRQRKSSEDLAYRTSLISASRSIGDHEFEVALDHLEDAPERLRGWAWAVVRSQIDREPDRRRTVPLSWPTVSSEDGGGCATIARNGSVTVWDSARWTVLHELEVKAERVFFRDDGNEIVVAGGAIAGQTRYWVQRVGSSAHAAARLVGTAAGSLHAQALAPNGNRLVSSDGLRLIAIDVDAGEVIAEGPELPGQVGYLTYAPDGKTLAAAALSGDVYWIDAATLAPIAVLRGHVEYCTQLSISLDSSMLASASYDGTSRLWDLTAETPVEHAVLVGSEDNVRGIEFSRDGSVVVTHGEERLIHLYDVTTGKALDVITGHGDRIAGVCRGPGPQEFISADEGGGIRQWSSTGLDSRLLRGHESFVYGALASPLDGTWVTFGWDGYVGEPGAVRRWDDESGELVGAWGTDTQIVRAGAMSPEGRRLALAIEETDLDLGRRSRIEVRDASTMRVLQTLEIDTRVYSLDFDASGDRLLIGGNTGTIWTLTRGQPTAVPHAIATDDELGYRYAKFGPTGCIAVTADFGHIEVLGAVDAEVIARWQAHHSTVLTVAFDSRGRRLVTTGYDGAINVWDVETQALLASFRSASQPMCARFSPDDALIVTGRRDGIVRVWRTSDYRQIAEFHGHEEYVAEFAWSPDGERLISVSGDGTARIWDALGSEERARRITTRSRRSVEVEPRVAALFDSLGDAALVAEAIRAGPEWDEAERVVGLQIVLALQQQQER